MTDKVRLGIPVFDEQYGGIYRQRCALCIGARNSGKTITALRYLLQGAQEGDRSLMISAWRTEDLILVASQNGLNLERAISQKNITLLEYGEFLPSPEMETNLTLPPESFFELLEIIENKQIKRVVIDSVLPWVAIKEKDKLAKHVYSFIRAMDRAGVTTLLTLPKAVSTLANELKNRLVEQVPVVINLTNEEEVHKLIATKYLGNSQLLPAEKINLDVLAKPSAQPAKPKAPAPKPEPPKPEPPKEEKPEEPKASSNAAAAALAAAKQKSESEPPKSSNAAAAALAAAKKKAEPEAPPSAAAAALAAAKKNTTPEPTSPPPESKEPEGNSTSSFSFVPKPDKPAETKPEIQDEDDPKSGIRFSSAFKG